MCGVADLAKREGVQIKLYSIIYELIDEVKEADGGLARTGHQGSRHRLGRSPQGFRIVQGRQRLPVAWSPAAASSRARPASCAARKSIYEGIIQTLRRFQDEVNEVRAGMECGIRIEGFSEYQPGDVIECLHDRKSRAQSCD